MRIIECDIHKFGVICNKRFTFSPNSNCILEENGVGKTTLCAFIKAMLYGIGDTKKTSLDENDRKRYLPWGAGSAQGALTFSVGGKTYRVERTFGAKASEDTFVLYDVKSGQISNDYTENLGCELFGIDRDGYEQTVYLSERALAPTGENKSVSAKLSDLVGADGDIGVMDEAMRILENQRKFLQKKGGVGAISDARRALDLKRDEISTLNEREERVSQIEGRLNEIAVELDKIKSERDALMSLQAESAKSELSLGFEEKCKELISEIESEVAEKDSIIQKLGGEVPERAYIDALRLDYIEAQKLISQGREQKESSGEAAELSLLFVTDTADSDVASLKDALEDYRELARIKATREYAEIQETFSKRIPSKDECDEAITRLTTVHPRGKSVSVIAIILAVIALPSILLGVTLTPMFFALSGVAAVTMIVILITGAIKQKKASSAAARYADELLCSISERRVARSELLSEIVKARSLIDKAEEIANGKLSRSERTLWEILSKYGRTAGDSVKNAELLIAEYERYRLSRMREGVRLEAERKDSERADKLLRGVKEAFERLGIRFSGSFSEIYALLDRYRELSSSIIAKREEYVKYKTETRLDGASELGAITGEELTAKISELDARSRELNSEAGVLNMQLKELNRLLSERGALVSEREALSDRLSQYEENLAVISKTKELLTKAKDNIQSKYLGATEAAFSKYVEKISGISGGEYRLDTNFNVTKSEGGISRPAAAYSRGSRGLYNLAARLALIDSLYREESPFIILDDPFAYLDDAKMQGAAEVVRSLSDDRQIIYLTCVKSRCIKSS